MRAAAAVTAFVICLLCGLRKSFLLKKRALLLRELMLLLEQYSIEMKSTAPTLYELSEKSTGEFGALLRECAENSPDIRQAWRAAAERLGQKPYCRENEIRILNELGSALGTCPAEGALSLLEMYSGNIAALCREAEADNAQKGKLYRSAGALAGLGAAVLII